MSLSTSVGATSSSSVSTSDSQASSSSSGSPWWPSSPASGSPMENFRILSLECIMSMFQGFNKALEKCKEWWIHICKCIIIGGSLAIRSSVHINADTHKKFPHLGISWHMWSPSHLGKYAHQPPERPCLRFDGITWATVVCVNMSVCVWYLYVSSFFGSDYLQMNVWSLVHSSGYGLSHTQLLDTPSACCPATGWEFFATGAA